MLPQNRVKTVVLTRWPKATDPWTARHFGGKLDDTTREAKLVPRLHHGRLNILFVDKKLFGLFVKGSVQVFFAFRGYP